MPHFKTEVSNSKHQIDQILCSSSDGTLHSHWFISLQQVLTSADCCLATAKLSLGLCWVPGVYHGPCKSLGSCRIHIGILLRVCSSSLPSLADRLSFPLLKLRHTDIEEGKRCGIAFLDSCFRSKLRYNLGDSNQMTEFMLSVMGNWMGLSYSAFLHLWYHSL